MNSSRGDATKIYVPRILLPRPLHLQSLGRPPLSHTCLAGRPTQCLAGAIIRSTSLIRSIMGTTLGIDRHSCSLRVCLSFLSQAFPLHEAFLVCAKSNVTILTCNDKYKFKSISLSITLSVPFGFENRFFLFHLCILFLKLNVGNISCAMAPTSKNITLCVLYNVGDMINIYLKYYCFLKYGVAC